MEEEEEEEEVSSNIPLLHHLIIQGTDWQGQQQSARLAWHLFQKNPKDAFTTSAAYPPSPAHDWRQDIAPGSSTSSGQAHSCMARLIVDDHDSHVNQGLGQVLLDLGDDMHALVTAENSEGSMESDTTYTGLPELVDVDNWPVMDSQEGTYWSRHPYIDDSCHWAQGVGRSMSKGSPYP